MRYNLYRGHTITSLFPFPAQENKLRPLGESGGELSGKASDTDTGVKTEKDKKKKKKGTES